MEDFKKLAESSSTFCIMPFTHIDTKTTGELKFCCRSLPLYNIKDMSLLEVWNSEIYRRVRKQVLSSERPQECQECWYLEDNNVRSMRQRQNILKCEYGDHLKVLDDLREDYSMPDKIMSIELKLNNMCNLKCRMCHPLDSIQWVKDWPLIADLQEHNEWTYNNVRDYNLAEKPYLCEWENHPSFFEDLENITDNLETIWFAGGEPLVDPMHYMILDKIKDRAENIKLQYATNLTRLSFRGKSLFDYWKHFKAVLLSISFDGLYDVFDYIRTNSNFESVMKNINIVKDTAKREGLDITPVAACTFQAYNIFDLPKMFKFLIENQIWIHTHRVMWPNFLSCQVLPKELKEIVTKDINKFISEIKSMGLEIGWEKNALKNTIDCLNFMNGDDLNNLWPDFLEYNRRLDKALGGKTLVEIRPEIKGFI